MILCNSKSPKAKDPRYFCNEKTKRWNLRSQRRSGVRRILRRSARRSVRRILRRSARRIEKKSSHTTCNSKSPKAKDPRYFCNEKTKRWNLRIQRSTVKINKKKSIKVRSNIMECMNNMPVDCLIKFYSKSKYDDNKSLSNFSDYSVVINGTTYPTGEHAFQAEKYKFASKRSKGERKEELRDHYLKFSDGTFKTALDAKRGAGKGKQGLRLDLDELDGWYDKSIKVQKIICNYKLDNYSEIENFVKKSINEGCGFLHQDNRAKTTTPWGGRVSKDDNKIIGQNLLGIVWYCCGLNII
jgi:hypothetical protein